MPQGAVNFALKLAQLEGGSPVDYNTITDLFLQVFSFFSFCFIQKRCGAASFICCTGRGKVIEPS